MQDAMYTGLGPIFKILETSFLCRRFKASTIIFVMFRSCHDCDLILKIYQSKFFSYISEFAPTFVIEQPKTYKTFTD